ncbi:MAG: hypothetical protein GQ563_00995, partial [Desulfuromusa sp.]|nr:hypothetical protein [Desulfuromusa sp.]
MFKRKIYISSKITLISTLLCLAFTLIPTTSSAQKKKSEAIDEVHVNERTGTCFAMYTTQNKILKMTVKLFPLKDGDSREVSLSIKENGNWKEIAKEQVSEELYNNRGTKSWTVLFRIENWDDTKPYEYRVTALNGKDTYDGLIRKNPIDKNEIKVAAFTGNSKKGIGAVYKKDIISNLKYQDPDLLFFSGDQIYGHAEYLHDWLLFGLQFGDVIRNTPTVCIPDDHDVGLGNLWGEGGKEGLYQGYGDPQFVRMVERDQVSNLPDPYDPTPILRGIGVYYTSLKIGRVDFAIIEDRKFKTNPETLFKRLDEKDIKYEKFKITNLQTVEGGQAVIDFKDMTLLGERQLKFLREWGTDW